MGPTRRAALQAGALVALGDAWALRRAWGGAGERIAIALAVAALVVGAALLLTPWLHALVDRRWSRSLGAAALAGALAGVPLGATPTAGRALGLAAAPLLALAVALVLWAVARAPRWPGAAIGLTHLALALALPRRLYPSLRAALLVIAFAALACALRRAAEARRPNPRAVVAATAVALALLLAGRALAGLDADARFVLYAQAPTAAFVLDALALAKPIPRSPVPAADTAASAPLDRRAAADDALGGARFVHADSLADAHLVVVTVDALRADRLRSDRMPLVAALAARGVTFTHAYAVVPSTAASITALMTARHPLHFDDRPPTLAEHLRAAGWNTADFYPAGLFFDGGATLRPYADAHFGVAWADTRTLAADALTDAALERVRVAVARGEPRSFFWLHYFDPHEPYDPHELPADAPAIDRYDAEVRAVDRALGRLVDGLAAFARPTLLVVTGDHGEEFGEHGGAYHGSSLYDEQLRVPLVVALLGRELSPERIDAPVSLVDVAPALCRLLEAPRFGDAPVGGGDVYASVDTHRMMVRGGWKLIHDTRRDVDELYDLAADPGEQHNLGDARADVAATLHAALAQWLNQPSVAELAAAVADRSRPASHRAAAARALGTREAYGGREALRTALAGDDDASVRAEAALALAQLTDDTARATLRAIVVAADPALADRAAVMLGRLRDPAAAPRLAAICRRAPSEGDRQAATLQREAAHYLGFVGDATDVDALFAAAADPRVRGSAYLAIGHIAGRAPDAAAAAARLRLRQRLAVEDRDDARIKLLAALALADEPKEGRSRGP